MKVAVFSDVQANYPALGTVTEHILNWSPDLVIMNGDLVNRGPCSLDCLNLFEELRAEHGWIALRGNHEDFVLRCSKEDEPTGSPLEQEMQQFTNWTSEQLGNTAFVMEAWSDDYSFAPPGEPDFNVRAMHGSMLGNRVGILAHTTEEELATRIPENLNVFLTAHTHRPLQMNYRGCEIVNVGSAGSPFDKDPRASYAQLTFANNRWNIEIVRLEYDRETADKDYYSTGFLEEGGPMARLIYEEWKQAASLMPIWRRKYFEALKSGEITLKQSIDALLTDLGASAS